MNAFSKIIDFNSNVAPARTADVSGLLEDDDRIAWVRRVRLTGYRYVHNHGDPLDMNRYGFRNDDTHGDDTEAFIDAMKRRILFGAPENWG